MDYKNYQQARDMSWRMLIKCNIMSVPVQVVHVCKQNGWSVYTYRAMHDYLQKTGLLQYSQTTDGFTLRMHGNYAIFVDDTMSSERQRFTIAHEIGHIVCGHLQDGGRTVICREPAATDSPQERQANIFASRFLAPACVLEKDDEPWFVGKDVAQALGYGEGKSLANAVANHVDTDDKGVTEMMTPGGKQNMTIINESGLYSLILSSKLPTAKAFKRWVTNEVLPSIRKTNK